jgi:hypothetical protein
VIPARRFSERIRSKTEVAYDSGASQQGGSQHVAHVDWYAPSKEAIASLPASIQQKILGYNAAEAYQLS